MTVQSLNQAVTNERPATDVQNPVTGAATQRRSDPPTTAVELTAAIRTVLKQKYPSSGIKARTQRNARYTTIIVTYTRGTMGSIDVLEAEAEAYTLISNYENYSEGTPYFRIWSR